VAVVTAPDVRAHAEWIEDVARRHGLAVRWNDRGVRCLLRVLDPRHRCRAHAPSWHPCLDRSVWLRGTRTASPLLVLLDDVSRLPLFRALADEHLLAMTVCNWYRPDNSVSRLVLLEPERDAG
jgi:hypothetical protein